MRCPTNVLLCRGTWQVRMARRDQLVPSTSCAAAAVQMRCRSDVSAPPPSPESPSSPATSTTAAASTAAASASPVNAHVAFRSATKFKLTPTQVNETNVPTAREVTAMIPTLAELQAQLPDARALEQQYIQPHLAQAADTTGSATSAPNTTKTSVDGIFQKTTDPIEDLLFGPPKEEKKGDDAATTAADDEAPRPQRRHLLLAYQALLWGTVYAFLGFGVTVVTAMYVCGYHSVRELMDGVRGKVGRDEAALRAAAAATGRPSDSPVEHYVIDLTHPTEAWKQIQEVWTAVQRLAEEEEEEKKKSQLTAPSASQLP